MQTVYKNAPAELVARFDTADRLAPLMVSASQIAGNPRLVKRFLNALSIRMAISSAHDVGVDEAVLAKMLLFERCGNQKAYGSLTAAVNNDPDGKPVFLAEWEQKATAGEELELDTRRGFTGCCGPFGTWPGASCGNRRRLRRRHQRSAPAPFGAGRGTSA